MKLSAILRAAVRPYVNINDFGDRFVLSDPAHDVPWDGAGVGVFCDPRTIPPRAKSIRVIGDLTVAWWGRDTLVHPTEAS